VILLTFHGLAGAIFMPASQLLINDIVGNKDLQSAVRLTATSRQVGLLLGPAVGGGLLLALGPGWGIAANALIYGPMIWWSLREPYTGHTREGAPSQVRLGLKSAVAVIKEASANRTILVMIALVGLTSLLVGNAYHAQMPEFANGFLSGDAKGLVYTALLAANAAGAVFGGLMLEGLSALAPEPRKAMVLAGLWSVCIVGFAASPHYILALIALFAAGILQIGFTSMATTLVQLEAPPARRGQIIGVFSMSMNGLRIGSGVTVGFLGALVGIHWSLGLSAGLLLLSTIVLFLLARSTKRTLTPAGRPSTLTADAHVHTPLGGCC
jgi:MFS family permease